MGKLSTLEHLYAGQAERDSSMADIFRQQRARQAELENGSTQREFEDAVRALPDSLFGDHAEVIRLTADAGAVRRRAKAIAMGGTDARLQAAARKITEDQQRAEAELREAAIDDLLDGDAGFARALAVLERVENCQRRRNALRAASDLLEKPREMRNAIVAEEVQRAEVALRELLSHLKRAYLRDERRNLAEPATCPTGDRASSHAGAAHET